MTHLTGTLALMRFILKRDKISLLCWILILPLMPMAAASAFAKLYPTAEAIQIFAASVEKNPAELAMLGHVLSPTLGGLVAWRWTIQSGLFLGIFNLFFVIKHTRTEEASGRYELLSSTAIGRYAILTATFGVAFLANFLIGASISAYLIGYGLPVTGSITLGISGCLIGIFMAACTAVIAQLTREGGAAKGIMGAILAILYAIKMVADSGDYEWLTWFSPICWLYKMHAYANENWAIVPLLLIATFVLMGLSYFLLSKRELGAGFLKEKEKTQQTSPYLNNSFALMWRLHKSMIFWWSFSFAFLGALCGAMMDSVSDQVGTNPQLQAYLAQLGNSKMGDLMFTLMIALFAQLCATYAVMANSKLQQEEMEHRSDIILASSVGRVPLALQHLGIMLGGMSLILFSFGVAAGVCQSMIMGGNMLENTLHLMKATFAFLPALCVIAALGFFIFAISPKYFYLNWAFLAFVILMSFVRELVPDVEQISKLSPFSHVPQVLLGDKNWENFIWLSLIAVAFSVAGLVFYKRRDLV